MRSLKKAAYYTYADNRINLDCDNYLMLKKNGDLGHITIAHEYMRAAGKEGGTSGSADGIDVGDEVMNSSGEYGNVMGIFPDGKLMVYFRLAKKHQFYYSSELARTAGCAEIKTCK